MAKAKKNLTSLIERRHPGYNRNLPHWDFLESTYDGGREWFVKNIFRYLKEGDKEYAERVQRAYRFNHTRHVVDIVDKYLFKLPVHRSGDGPETLQKFWNRSTLSGLDIDVYAKRISNCTSKYGRCWVVVDSTSTADTAAVTVSDAKKASSTIYSYIVRPQDMLDYALDGYGEMIWCLIREFQRDDEDPIESSGEVESVYRLWTKTEWMVIKEVQTRRGIVHNIEDSGVHDLGVVPVIRADHQFTEDPYDSPGLVDDIAYLDRANANYLSNIDAIIQDQTFSQLMMPAQGVLPGQEAFNALVELGTKRMFVYNGDSPHSPQFISPDPRQAQMILSAIGKIINEIYHSVGLSAERTKDDNGGGVDNASGVAKAYDFERVNSLLAAKAQSLELIENKIANLVLLWDGVDTSDKKYVMYPTEFDTRTLYNEFEVASSLSILNAPDEIRQKQMLELVTKLFPGITEADKATLSTAIKGWKPTETGLKAATAASDARAQQSQTPTDGYGQSSAATQLVQKTAK